MRSGAARTRAWLLIILTLALAMRVWGLDHGLPHVRTRPDELFIFGIVMNILGGNPNPGMFDYPSLYIYFVTGLFAAYYWWCLAAGRLGSHAEFRELFRTDYEPFFLMARGTTALFGTLTVWVIHAVAVPLFGRAVGLLSALFLSVAFLHARNSHFATTDVPLTLFVTCAVLAALRVQRTRSARWAWLAGLAAGMAVGIKYNAAPVVIPLAIVEALHAWSLRADWRRAWRETHIWRMALATVAIFLATSPYLVLDAGNAFQQLRGLAAQASAGMTPPELLGSGWGYHLPFSLRHGLGVPLLGASLAGLAWMAISRPGPALVLGSFPVAYYAAAGMGYNVFVRYMIPVVPFLCLFAAYLVWEVAVRAAVRLRVPAAVPAVVLAIVVAAPSAARLAQFNWLLTQDDSRLLAARWIEESVPAGSRVYMSGNLYGHPQIGGAGKTYELFGYDWRAATFTHLDRSRGALHEYPIDERPDYIVVQRSAIPYSHIPEAVEALIPREYDLVHTIRAANLEAPNPYDIQDGFYLAYGHYEGVRRPGPNFEIYKRRGS